MRKLHGKNINVPALADHIFTKRWRKQLHYIDFPRFQALAKYFQGGRYLDIGCFNSPMPYELKLAFPDADIWALDHAPETIAELSPKFPEVHYICHDILRTDLDPSSFDYIVAGELIEHLEDPRSFIKKCFAAIKPGGYFALSTPENDAGTLTEEHIWSFSLDDIVEFLAPFGKVETEIITTGFPTILAWCKKYDRT